MKRDSSFVKSQLTLFTLAEHLQATEGAGICWPTPIHSVPLKKKIKPVYKDCKIILPTCTKALMLFAD